MAATDQMSAASMRCSHLQIVRLDPALFPLRALQVLLSEPRYLRWKRACNNDRWRHSRQAGCAGTKTDARTGRGRAGKPSATRVAEIKYIGHNCIGHRSSGHGYIGHQHTGHNYIGRANLPPFEPQKLTVRLVLLYAIPVRARVRARARSWCVSMFAGVTRVWQDRQHISSIVNN